MNWSSSLLKQLKNEKGSSLVLVLLVIVMFTILGISLMGLGLNHLKMSASERIDQSTYYIAEAGIVEAMSEIKDKVEKINAKTEGEFFAEVERIFADIKPPSFEKNFGSQPEAVVSIKKGIEKGDYSLVSEGRIDNKKRILVKGFKVEWSGSSSDGSEPGDTSNLPNDLTALIKGTINLKEGATIKGKVATTLSIDKNPITILGGAMIDGEIVYGITDYLFEIPLFPQIPEYPTPSNKELINSSGNRYNVINNGSLLIDSHVSNHYRLEMSDNLSFKEVKLTNNYNLTINTGDSDKEIVVDDLNVTNGHIKIEGAGKLTIYVKDKIIMGSGSTINSGRSFNNLNVYLKGSGSLNNPKLVKLAGNQMIHGSLFSEDANIEIGRGGGFQGHIFTGGSKISIIGGGSGNPAFIYAPNAIIEFKDGGLVKGTVVGSRLIADGGITISFEKIDTKNIPFFPSNPVGEESTGGVVIDTGGTKEK